MIAVVDDTSIPQYSISKASQVIAVKGWILNMTTRKYISSFGSQVIAVMLNDLIRNPSVQSLPGDSGEVVDTADER